MELTFERDQALGLIGNAVAIVERKQIIPILGNVALKAEGDGLVIRTTDQGIEVLETIPAKVSTEGEVTMPADKLHEIVRSADDGAQVQIVMDGADPRARVRSGRSTFRVPTLPAKDFPRFNSDGLGEGFPIAAKLLADMIARVKWMADASKPTDVKAGVFLSAVDGELVCVAASSHGVAICKAEAPLKAKLRALLPMKLANQLARWLAELEGDVMISAADWAPGDRADNWKLQRMLRVHHAGGQLTSNLFDAPDYVNYGMVHISENELSAVTDQDALTTAIRRVLIMQDSKVGAVRLDFSPGAVAVQARNAEAGEGVEELAAEYDGPPATVMLKPSMIMDTLGALRGDQVKLSFAPKVRDRDALSVKVLVEAPADPGFAVTMAQPRA